MQGLKSQLRTQNEALGMLSGDKERYKSASKERIDEDSSEGDE